MAGRRGCCAGCVDIRVLFWKNWILKRRRWASLIFELLLPVAFIALFSWLKTLEPDVAVPAGWSIDDPVNEGCSSDCEGESVSLFANRSFTLRKGVLDVESSNFLQQVTVPRFYGTETSMVGFLLGITLQTFINSPSALQDRAVQNACAPLIATGNLGSIPAGCPVIPFIIGVVAPDEAWFRYFNETMSRWYPSVALTPGTLPITNPSWASVVRFFKDEDSLTDYVRDRDYGKIIEKPKLIGAFDFKKTPAVGAVGDWEYSVRLNATLNENNLLFGTVDTKEPMLDPVQKGISSNAMLQYAIGGFTTFQTAVTRFALCNPDPSTFLCQNSKVNMTSITPEFISAVRQYLNDDIPLNTVFSVASALASQSGFPVKLNAASIPNASLAQIMEPLRLAPQPILGGKIYAFPVDSYTSAPFFVLIQRVFPLVFVAAFLYGLSRILVSFIAEKEEKQREALQLMGVSSLSIITSWYLTYGLMLFVSSILMTVASTQTLFANSSAILIFLYYFFFSLSIISYAFLMSTFFSRSRVGSLTGLSIFFMMYFIYYGVEEPEVSSGTKFLTSLLSPVAMALGANTLATFESSTVGVNFGNVSDQVNNYSFGTCLSMLLFDSILYTFLACYLEQVLPRQWGIRRPWYFCCSPRYWRKAKKRKDDDKALPLADPEANDSKPNIEPVSMEYKAQETDGRAVVVRGLRKEFKTPGGIKVAVKGLDLAMYEGQITCLLGHNGAGKTTTISMLTGMLEATAGDAIVNGYSIRENMSAVRESLGLCPQHDILYLDMTVKEHLELYGAIKGMKGKALKEEVAKKIAEVGLTEKVNARARELSGGMKRKLSVAIALLGGSKMVFLDEPTSGMDPYSRRSTWDLIQNNKDGRVIVLTTHFMDEADLLGDRIAIMADGELRCCGSSLFLKNRYGVGYNLTIIKSEFCKVQETQRLIKGYVREAKLLSNVGAEIIFQLPLSSASSFPSLFSDLDLRLRELGLVEYGVSVTTLEEVFIKVAELGDLEEQEALRQTSSRFNSMDSSSRHLSRDVGSSAAAATPAPSGPPNYKLHHDAPPASPWVHFEAVFTKRFQYARRDKKAVVCAVLLPILLLIVGLIQLKVNQITKDYPRYVLDTEDYTGVSRESDSDVPTPYVCLGGSPNCPALFSKTEVGVFQDTTFTPYSGTGNFFGVSYPDIPGNSSKGASLQFGQSVFNYAFGANGVPPRSGYSQYGGFIYQSDANNLASYNIIVNTTSSNAAGIFKRQIDQALYRTMAGGDFKMEVSNHPLPLTLDAKSLFTSFTSFSAITYILFAMAFIPANIAAFIVQEREVLKNAKHQQLVSGVSLPAFWLANYAWDFLVYLITFVFTLILIAAFNVKTFTGSDCQQNCIENVFLGVGILFFLFGLAVIPFTYLIQSIFAKHSSAQYVTYFINFILGLVLMIVIFVLRTLDSTKDAAEWVVFIFRVFPPFCLAEGLLNLTLQDLETAFNGERAKDVSVFDSDIHGWVYGFLIVEVIVYTVAAIGLDIVSCNPSIKARFMKDPDVKHESFDEDEDVLAEKERVLRGDTEGDLVTLKGLRKVYKGLKGKKKVGLHDLYYSIPAGQCFGFLGINGAGKTTTMKIITGEILPTMGSGTIGGKDILKEQLAVRRLIGYCPQFDALLDLLTVREHLELFAKIKGVPKERLNEVVLEKMTQMDLLQYENKLANSLSGGNKRKLSVGIAMIGSPPVLFLDEPSTGMDPVARRFMWEVIAKVSTESHESSVVLTTHSMEECEALCTNVGIMVGGRLRCLGSVQHLKSRFGSGLMMEMRQKPVTAQEAAAFANREIGVPSLTSADLPALCARLGRADRSAMISPDSDNGWAVYSVLERDGKLSADAFAAWWLGEDRADTLVAFMRRAFEGADLLERHETLFRWKVGSERMSLAQIFACIEGAKKELFIREYSVSQTSLEQVFNQFAAQQEEEKGKVRGLQHQTEAPVNGVAKTRVEDEYTKLASPSNGGV